MNFDISILTAEKYLHLGSNPSQYLKNLLLEDNLLIEALKANGLRVNRLAWSDKEFDWGSTKAILFKTIWDYHERFDEFKTWLDRVNEKTQLINPYELIHWNMDKHYLADLEEGGVNVVKSYFVDKGDSMRLADHLANLPWEKVVVKPVVSGTARATFVVNKNEAESHESTFKSCVQKEDMMIQPYLESITTEGEVSHITFGGKYSHSILKQATNGDFRIQQNFGGTINIYDADSEELEFVKNTLAYFDKPPTYARVDLVRDNDGELAVGELEMIEPELWFRLFPNAAPAFAEVLAKELA